MNTLNSSPARGWSGFTRLELVAILMATTVLCLVAVPLLAQGQARSRLAICLNNLHQVGRAMLTWNADHQGADPWRVDQADGGTRNHFSGLQNNIWFQFAWLSNELRTPKILACPSDTYVRVASDFSGSSNGFLDASIRNQGISYFLGLDAFPQSPQSVMSGDRHCRFEPGSTACSSGIAPVYNIDLGPNGGWNSTNLHGVVGHLLFHDGRVELRSSTGLKAAFERLQTQLDYESWHTLAPRAGN